MRCIANAIIHLGRGGGIILEKFGGGQLFFFFFDNKFGSQIDNKSPFGLVQVQDHHKYPLKQKGGAYLMVMVMER